MSVACVALCLSVLAAPAHACWGYSYYDDGTKIIVNNTQQNFTVMINQYIAAQSNGSNPAFQGFPIPGNVSKAWKDWLADYVQRKKLEEAEGENYYGEGGAGSGKYKGWPKDWMGMGKGDVGFPPDQIPPWGYRIKNLGLPQVCYLYADHGTECRDSDDAVTRWGFNAHVQECMEFEYLGCEGNENNFETELECLERCTHAGPEGCDQETDIAVQGSGIADDLFRTRRCGYDVKEVKEFGKPVF